MSQTEPVLGGSRLQGTERADDALARAVGSLVGFDQEVIEVGFPLDSLGGTANEHPSLYIRLMHGSSNGNVIVIRHYLRS